mgnify:CR=1 FL=1
MKKYTEIWRKNMKKYVGNMKKYVLLGTKKAKHRISSYFFIFSSCLFIFRKIPSFLLGSGTWKKSDRSVRAVTLVSLPYRLWNFVKFHIFMLSLRFRDWESPEFSCSLKHWPQAGSRWRHETWLYSLALPINSNRKGWWVEKAYSTKRSEVSYIKFISTRYEPIHVHS